MVLELTLFTNFGIIILVRYSVMIINRRHRAYNACRQNIAHLRQECHNSKFGTSELLLWEETSAAALLTGIVSSRILQNSPLEKGCVIVALIENYSTSDL